MVRPAGWRLLALPETARPLGQTPSRERRHFRQLIEEGDHVFHDRDSLDLKFPVLYDHDGFCFQVGAGIPVVVCGCQWVTESPQIGNVRQYSSMFV